jgi:hypothetical protein
MSTKSAGAEQATAGSESAPLLGPAPFVAHRSRAEPQSDARWRTISPSTM